MSRSLNGSKSRAFLHVVWAICFLLFVACKAYAQSNGVSTSPNSTVSVSPVDLLTGVLGLSALFHSIYLQYGHGRWIAQVEGAVKAVAIQQVQQVLSNSSVGNATPVTVPTSNAPSV